MKPTPHSMRRLALACAGALAFAPGVHATEQTLITNARGAASAASDPTAVRTMKFTTHQAVPATLTLHRGTPLADGWTAQFRFAGQTDRATCVFHLPKSGQRVQDGETATGTILCKTPWQLYDNGLAFDAFENGRKVAQGTLRP